MQSESALRQAVEEQLDLILRIEEERKLLKKENRVLKDEHQKMMNTLKKYHVERIDQAVCTDAAQASPEKEAAIQLEQSVQVDLDVPQANTSKLSSAQDLLKQLNISSQSLCSRCEDQLINTSHGEREAKRTPAPSSSQQVSNEIVKLAKEIAALKRELKESEGRGRQREKELKEARKCLEVKGEALEKSRREFN